MTRRTAMSLFSAFIVLAAAGSYGYHALISRDGAPPKILVNAQPAAAKGDTGEPAVIVKANAQRASGIMVAPLAASTVPTGQIAYVTVLDLKPLFDLHNSYATARANRDAATVQADTSAAQYERQRTLYQDSRATSQKSMQDAQAAMNNDEAKLKVTEVALSDVAANAREQFGDALATAVTDEPSDLFAKLAQRKASILLVSFPPDRTVPAPSEITVDGPQQQAVAASRMSVAPQADPSVQGNSYLYLSRQSLPVGSRTIAHASSGGGYTAGLFIPGSAIVWYGGQQWVYVKTGTEHFVRRPVEAATPVASGLIVTNGFKAGELVVVQGAQLLLSQELRPKDVTTECKDPPECDD